MKYNWSEKQCDEVIRILTLIDNRERPYGRVRTLLAKLDPRPNFREGEVCIRCHEWKECCSTRATKTCDNFHFQQEKVEAEDE